MGKRKKKKIISGGKQSFSSTELAFVLACILSKGSFFKNSYLNDNFSQKEAGSFIGQEV